MVGLFKHGLFIVEQRDMQMSEILSDEQVRHYLEHAAHKYPELSTEREIIQTLAESHLAQSAKNRLLDESNNEQFSAIVTLAFALQEKDAELFAQVCADNPLLEMLKERGVF